MPVNRKGNSFKLYRACSQSMQPIVLNHLKKRKALQMLQNLRLNAIEQCNYTQNQPHQSTCEKSGRVATFRVLDFPRTIKKKTKKGFCQITQIDLPSAIAVTIPFDELGDVLLRKWVSENPIPLLCNPIQVHFLLRRSGSPGPFPVESTRTERRELRRFSEPNGLHGRVGFRIRVLEVEWKVRLERSYRVFLGIQTILLLLLLLRLVFLRFWVFGSRRKRRVVRVFTEGLA